MFSMTCKFYMTINIICKTLLFVKNMLAYIKGWFKLKETRTIPFYKDLLINNDKDILQKGW